MLFLSSFYICLDPALIFVRIYPLNVFAQMKLTLVQGYLFNTECNKERKPTGALVQQMRTNPYSGILPKIPSEGSSAQSGMEGIYKNIFLSEKIKSCIDGIYATISVKNILVHVFA